MADADAGLTVMPPRASRGCTVRLLRTSAVGAACTATRDADGFADKNDASGMVLVPATTSVLPALSVASCSTDVPTVTGLDSASVCEPTTTADAAVAAALVTAP